MRSVGAAICAAAACLAMCGCMKMGPDYKRPEMAFKRPEAYFNAEKGSPVVRLPEDRWWQEFGNPEINRLVEKVIANNLDLRKAIAQIEEIEARYRQTRADRFPTLGVQGQWQKQRQTVANLLTGKSSAQTTDNWAVSLPASYEIDLWGRLARAAEAARKDLLAAEENRHTLAQSLVAEAVSRYFEMESLERRIQFNRKSVETFRRNRDLVEGRYQRGLSNVLTVRQSRRLLAQAEAVLPALEQELGLVQQQLAVLTGTYPQTRPERTHDADYYQMLAPVPPGLPSELLNRRPDIRAAEAQLTALNDRVGAAKASRFPRISLTASFGYASDDLSSLFKPESEIWNLAAGITQPLFDAGKLAAAQQAAEARYRQGLVDYAQTVLNAFSEVEGALLTRKQQLERRRRMLLFLEEAKATEEAAQSRYERGLTDYLTVLDAQRTRYQAEESLILVELSLLTNRVRLHRALGGGWGGLEQGEKNFSETTKE